MLIMKAGMNSKNHTMFTSNWWMKRSMSSCELTANFWIKIFRLKEERKNSKIQLVLKIMYTVKTQWEDHPIKEGKINRKGKKQIWIPMKSPIKNLRNTMTKKKTVFSLRMIKIKKRKDLKTQMNMKSTYKKWWRNSIKKKKNLNNWINLWIQWINMKDLID